MSCDCKEKNCCSNVGTTGALVNGLINSLELCKTLKCKCIQFVPDTKLFNSANPEGEKRKTLEYLQENKLSFYIHCPLFCNLALSLEDDVKNIVNKSKGVISSELFQIADLPAACILHIGTGGSIANVANRLNSMEINEGKYPGFQKQLLLEVAAGQGGQLGDNWNDIRKLFEAVDKPIGLCVDTQHAFASKMVSFENHESVVKLFENAEDSAKNIGVFHLNDSFVKYGSNVDRHAGLGKGFIWKENKESLKSLLEICNEKDINLVLETSNSQLKDLELVKKLMHSNE
jgi:deoxyribonuclease-4